MSTLVPVSNQLPDHVAVPMHVAPEPERMHLRQLLGAIMEHARLAGAVAAVTFVVILGLFALQPKMYSSSGTVVIDPKQQDLTSPNQQQTGGFPPDTGAVDTQVEILRSQALAEDVVKRLKLYNDPEFNPGMKPGLFGLMPADQPVTNPSPQLLATVTNTVQNHAWARREGLTYVVRVGFSSTSPQKARRIANAYLQTYLDRQLDAKLAEVTRANAELGKSLEKMRADAELAEARVQEYKIAHGLLSAEGATMAEQEVSNLNTQIAAAKADQAEKQARLAAAIAQLRNGNNGADVGAALGSDTIKELRKQEAETSVKLAQLEADFTPAYPEVQRTRAQLKDIRGQIQAEINRILSSLKADASAAAGRQASLLGSRSVAQGGLKSNSQAMVGLLALQQRADAAKTIYEGYLNRAKDVAAQGSLQSPDGRVNSPAALPTQPSSPNMKLGAVLAFLAAIILAAAAILAAELWDRGLRNRQSVERDLGVPFAGVLPDFASTTPKGVRKNANPADYLVDNPLSGFSEAFRNLRAFLALSSRQQDAKLIAITSAVPREGKSLTSMCLARTLALTGARVVLVDCDLRRRGVTKLASEREAGLVEVVEGSTTLGEALVQDERTPLWILPASGRTVPHDMFSTPESDEVMRQLANRFDFVILDTPPLLGVADARILAAKVDSVLYLVQWNKTPIRAARSAVDILRECGANVVGAALTKVNVNGQARYGYGDSSDYYGYFKSYYITAA